MLNAVPKRQCFVGLFDILGFGNMVKNDHLEYVWKSYKEIKSFCIITASKEKISYYLSI